MEALHAFLDEGHIHGLCSFQLLYEAVIAVVIVAVIPLKLNPLRRDDRGSPGLIVRAS